MAGRAAGFEGNVLQSGPKRDRRCSARYEPGVLLLDEPLSNLDPKLRGARFWIRKLILDLQICAVLVTHDQSESLTSADEILLLRGGRIVQSGAPQDIYSKPTASIRPISSAPTTSCPAASLARSGDTVTIGGNGWSLPAVAREEGVNVDANIRAVIRVEDIEVAGAASGDAVEMELTDSIYLGSKWEYRVQRDDFMIKAQGAKAFSKGKVWMSIPRDSVLVFKEELQY